MCPFGWDAILNSSSDIYFVKNLILYFEYFLFVGEEKHFFLWSPVDYYISIQFPDRRRKFQTESYLHTHTTKYSNIFFEWCFFTDIWVFIVNTFEKISCIHPCPSDLYKIIQQYNNNNNSSIATWALHFEIY